MPEELKQAAQAALDQLEFLNACYPHKTAADAIAALQSALTQRPAEQEEGGSIAAALGDIVALWDQHAPSEYMTAIHMQAKRALAGQQPMSPDMARWCAYVGGMVAHWVKSEPDALARLGDDAFEAAIAGIIERRLWAMPKPAPQQSTTDMADGPARMHWMNWMPVKDALEYAYQKMGLEMVKTDAGAKYPNLHWNLAGLVREFVVAQQDAMFGKCQACGKSMGLLDQIKCLDCGTRLCEPCAKEHFGSGHGKRAAEAHGSIEPTTSGWVETSAPPQRLDWSGTQQATPEPVGEVAGHFAQDKYGVWHMLPPGSTSGTKLYTHPAPGVPAGWRIFRTHDGIDVHTPDGGACYVEAKATADRRIPEEVLHALCSVMLAAAQAKGGE